MKELLSLLPLVLLIGCAGPRVSKYTVENQETASKNLDSSIQKLFVIGESKSDVENSMSQVFSIYSVSSSVQFTNQGKIEYVIYSQQSYYRFSGKIHYLVTPSITFHCIFLDGRLGKISWNR